MRALVRRPSPLLADCELTHLQRQPIDAARARAEHEAYVALLASLGAQPVWVEDAPEHPDGVFVEDVAVIAGPLAVLTRPGAESRRGEVPTMRAALRRLGVPTAELAEPAHLDGGDVLRIDRTFYIGDTARTDAAGRAAFSAAVAPHGFDVVTVGVNGVLHLKSGATALPDGTLVVWPGSVDLAAFGRREVLEAAEPQGADVLLVGDAVVVSAAAPRTAEAIAARGFAVHRVDVAELEKAEAGTTCMSVLLP
jgi:dimethylargininase